MCYTIYFSAFETFDSAPTKPNWEKKTRKHCLYKQILKIFPLKTSPFFGLLIQTPFLFISSFRSPTSQFPIKYSLLLSFSFQLPLLSILIQSSFVSFLSKWGAYNGRFSSLVGLDSSALTLLFSFLKKGLGCPFSTILIIRFLKLSIGLGNWSARSFRRILSLIWCVFLVGFRFNLGICACFLFMLIGFLGFCHFFCLKGDLRKKEDIENLFSKTRYEHWNFDSVSVPMNLFDSVLSCCLWVGVVSF